MALTDRPRRSALYMPASNARALEKAKTLACDMVIFDLEDAVAPDAKLDARKQAVAALDAGGYGTRECLIRINGLESVWAEDDIAAVAKSRADGLVIPKVMGPEDVQTVSRQLATADAKPSFGIWAMMETPAGVLAAPAVAKADERLCGLMMGTEDLSKDLRALKTPDRLALITSLGLCILAARAAGIAVLDTVYADLKDDAGFEHQCRQGRELGFDGKTLIHPKQIAAANRAYAPDEAAVAWARRIVAAHEAAAKEGKGIVVVDGRMIEGLHVAEARQLLNLAEMIAANDAASA